MRRANYWNVWSVCESGFQPLHSSGQCSLPLLLMLAHYVCKSSQRHVAIRVEIWRRGKEVLVAQKVMIKMYHSSIFWAIGIHGVLWDGDAMKRNRVCKSGVFPILSFFISSALNFQVLQTWFVYVVLDVFCYLATHEGHSGTHALGITVWNGLEQVILIRLGLHF